MMVVSSAIGFATINSLPAISAVLLGVSGIALLALLISAAIGYAAEAVVQALKAPESVD